MPTIPLDPNFAQQFHLRNTNAGQFDLNIINVWDDYTGDGVQVAVFEDGVDLNHPDLDDQFLNALGYDYSNNDFDPSATVGDPGSGSHGTAVFGIIGAEEGNGIGGVGVAWDVDMVAYRGYGSAGAEIYYDAAGLGDGLAAGSGPDNTNGNDNGSDVINMSAGRGSNVFSYATNEVTALEVISHFGREGLGTVFVKSSGNSRAAADSANREEGTAEAVDSAEHSINVAALRADGWVTFTSTPGANVLVSAFSHGLNNSGNITTTDRIGTNGYNTNTSANGGDYVNTFSGTSAAAPQVAGVVALMLEANPNLGWRDVQDILAYSARQVGSAVGVAANTGAPVGGGFEQSTQSNGSSWFWNDALNWNGGPLHFSNDYGFGLVDALSAVRLAETWETQQTSANQIVYDRPAALATTTVSSTLLEVPFTVPIDIIVEYVTVNFDFVVDDLADMEFFVISPDGTRVQLLNDTGDTQAFTTGAVGWEFGTHAFRGTVHEGEDDPASAGNWRVQFRNDDGSASGTMTINDFDIVFTGRPIEEDRLWVFTDEYSDYVSGPEHNSIFNSGFVNGILGTFNAAAVTSNTTLDFVANSGTIDGVGVQMANISRAYTGDGNDTVIGDTTTRFIHTGRGNDSIDGGTNPGGETLNGGPGTDTVNGGAGDDILIDGAFQTSEGQDALDGGADDDLIVVTWITGGNSYDGGSGNDTIDVSGDTFTVNVDLSAPSFTSFASTFTGFENAITGPGSNDVIGNAANNELIAGRGNDSILGNGGNDTIHGDDLPFGMLNLNTGSVTDQRAEASTFDAMPSGTFTVEWLFQSETQATGGTPFVSYAVSGTDNEFLVFGNTGGTIDVWVNGTATDTGITTADVFGGDVHRMSVSVNQGAGPNGRISLYIDGVEEFRGEGAGTNVALPISASGLFMIGQEQDGSTPGASLDPNQIIKGGIGDVRVWSIEREQADIDATQFVRFDALDLPANPALVANWQVDPDTGTFDSLTGSQAMVSQSPGSNAFTTERYSHDGGNDTIEGGDGADLVFGGSGNDAITAGVESNADGVDTVYGGAGNDTIRGGFFIDTLFGEEGDDLFLISGTELIDIIDGGPGRDHLDMEGYIRGGSPIVTINLDDGTFTHPVLGVGSSVTGIEDVTGSDLADSITGDDGGNELNGGIGDDTIEGGSGADTMDGGTGTNTLSYENTANGVTVQFSTGTVAGGDTDDSGDSFTNFQNMIGTAQADSINADDGSASNTIEGRGGNDYIRGFDGDDSLIGGDDNDVLEGDEGADTYLGGSGTDEIRINAGNADLGADSIDGGTDDDTLRYFDLGSDGTVADLRGASITSIEVLRSQGFSSSNSVDVQLDGSQFGIGIAFDSLFRGNPVAGSDTIVEIFLDGPGVFDLSNISFLNWGAQDLILIHGSGDANDVTGTSENDSIEGEGGNDSLSAGGGNDTLSGGDGNDTLNASEGDNDLDGGGQTDLADFTGGASGVDLDLQAGTATSTNPGDFAATLTGIEGARGTIHADSLTGSTFTADRLEGSDGDDRLAGRGGNDTLEGGIGNDTLLADSGDDHMNGGANTDTASFEFVPTSVSVNLQGGTASGSLSGNDILNGIENVIGTGERDVIYGANSANNRLVGANGNDDLYGLSGEDTLDGGGGADEAAGGSGDDSVIGGDGNDTLSGNSGNDTLDGGADNDTLLGGDDNDTLIGGSGEDRLEGGDGSDSLSGGSFADRLEGGLGDDTINGGSNFDTVLYTGLAAGVSVNLEAGTATGGGGTDTLSNTEYVFGSGQADIIYGTQLHGNRLEGSLGDDTLYGLDGRDTLLGGDDNDRLFGGSDVDRLLGGAGNDFLDGGEGTDFLTGGPGGDNFVFRAIGDTGVGQFRRDEVRDFDAAEGDVINLFLIDADANAPGDQSFSVVGSFSGTAGELTLLNTVKSGVNVTIASMDVDGDGLIDGQVYVVGTPAASDFIL